MNYNKEHNICPFCRTGVDKSQFICHSCGKPVNRGGNATGNGSYTTLEFIENALKDKYEIIGLLGKGGMASVYRARQRNIDRIVALKIIHPNLVFDDEFIKRFLMEARICGNLNHPNIVKIYDFGHENGVYFMAMELLSGFDLSSLIKKRKRIDSQYALTYLIPIAHALNYIHSKGFLHRDIKSANIFVCEDGRPVLMDFGIAFSEQKNPLTAPGTLLGTPQYLSPEQANGSKATAESDYYSLGVVLYEAITGRVPFTDPNPLLIIHKVVTEEALHPQSLNSNIPDYVADLTMGLLQKKAKDRIPFINYLIQQYRGGYSSGYVTPASNQPFINRWLLHSYSSHGGGRVLLRSLKILLFVMIPILLFGLIYIIIDETAGPDAYTQYEPLSDNIVQQTPVNNARDIPAGIPFIENKMTVRVGDTYIMRLHVSDSIWSLIMSGNSNGRASPKSGISYAEVIDFIERLNNYSGGNYNYRLPYLQEVKTGYSEGSLGSPTNEWLYDPPVFRGTLRNDLAKYYYPNFNDEAAEEKVKRRSNIYFRLAR